MGPPKQHSNRQWWFHYGLNRHILQPIHRRTEILCVWQNQDVQYLVDERAQGGNGILEMHPQRRDGELSLPAGSYKILRLSP